MSSTLQSQQEHQEHQEHKAVSRACPICNSRGAQVLRAQKFVLFEGHPLSDGYDVVACARCGFVYADTSATQEQYDEFYARHSKYDDATIATGGGASPGDKARLEEMAQALAPHALEVGGRQATILDVGSATGGLLLALRDLGFGNVLGLDPSPASRQWARENGGVEILTGSLFDAPHIEPRDVVLCSHVLEHVRDLAGAAQKLSAWVKIGGLLYVEVPDATRYADFLAAPFQDFNTEHINHFGLRDLDALLGPHGMQLIAHGTKEIEAAPGVPYPALWAIWRRDDAAAPSPTAENIEADAQEMARAMRGYIAASQGMLDAFDARLRELVPAQGPLIVWGTGQLMLKLLLEPALARADIRCFVDGNPTHHEQKLRGVPVVSPEALARRMEEMEENADTDAEDAEMARWPIVIGSTIHQDAIARRIRDELGWSNPVLTLAPTAA